MLKPRLIPCLLIDDGSLIKTVNFKNPKYIGDPINAVKIFNEKQVDEICIFDIAVSRCVGEPDYELIRNMASQSNMPVCYGGGIKNVDQALRIFSLGVEKIALNSILYSNLNIIKEIADKVGSQSIVVLDVKKRINGGYDLYLQNGTVNTQIDLMKFLEDIDSLPYGELLINSIDNDGSGRGYDMNMISEVYKFSTRPLTVLGGAGSLQDIKKLFEEFKLIGAAAGSFFLYKGRYKAVLINYPNKLEKEKLTTSYNENSK